VPEEMHAEAHRVAISLVDVPRPRAGRSRSLRSHSISLWTNETQRSRGCRPRPIGTVACAVSIGVRRCSARSALRDAMLYTW
jgi:hypothetical protein